MTKILLGNTKCGWSVDDENKEIIIYHPQSLVDKMKKKSNTTQIKFLDIEYIEVGWNNVPLAVGQNQHFVIFIIELKNKEKIQFNGTSNGITRDTFKEAILVLQKNNIVFKDEYHIMDDIINTDNSIWNILNKAELKRRNK